MWPEEGDEEGDGYFSLFKKIGQIFFEKFDVLKGTYVKRQGLWQKNQNSINARLKEFSKMPVMPFSILHVAGQSINLTSWKSRFGLVSNWLHTWLKTKFKIVQQAWIIKGNMFWMGFVLRVRKCVCTFDRVSLNSFVRNLKKKKKLRRGPWWTQHKRAN